MSEVLGLVGDIGGTNGRFALVKGSPDHPRIDGPRTLPNRDHASAEAAIDAYLKARGAEKPARVVLAVAGPVSEGAIHFTNLDWRLSEKGLCRDAGFKAARLVNDFAAQAMGAAHLPDEARRRIGPDVAAASNAPLAIMGPGTGFGMGVLADRSEPPCILSTEAGHIGFAPVDDEEVEVWRWLKRRHGRVSIERVLSGKGLEELYQALAEIGGEPARFGDGREVQAAAEAGDGLAARTVERFCLILGSAAGDLTLATGARGGVYVTGGVAQGLADRICSGGFRSRFESKGRFEAYMQAIPTFLVTDGYTALRGAARLVGGMEAA